MILIPGYAFSLVVAGAFVGGLVSILLLTYVLFIEGGDLVLHGIAPPSVVHMSQPTPMSFACVQLLFEAIV